MHLSYHKLVASPKIANTICSRKSNLLCIGVLGKLCKWRVKKSWNVFLLISSDEKIILEHMLLNDAVFSNNKIRYKYHVS